MGRAPCCDKSNVKKGPWSPEEDAKLKDFIDKHGTGGNWIALPHKAGLKRCGKSCRLRWLNYLRPNIKHGEFTEDEDRIICSLYANIGSRWSIIAGQLPGRTDNDIKNYWNTKLRKKLLAMIPSIQKKPSFLPSMQFQSPQLFDHNKSNTFLNSFTSFYNYNPNPNFMNTNTNMINSLLSSTTSHLVPNHINDSHLFSPPPPPMSSNPSIGMASNINYSLGFQDQNMNKEYYFPEVKEKMLMFGNAGEMSTTCSSSEGGGSSNMSQISYNKDLYGIKQDDQFALEDQIHGYMTNHHHSNNYVDQKPKGYFKNLIDNVNINSYLINGDDENKTIHNVITDGCYNMIDGSN